MTFALIGNQNCGKTTLFNQLTGSNQHVGNFPGVTVEKKEGGIKRHPEMILVDLPGIYSISPYTSEEVVTRDFLIQEKPEGIINIVDATSIERNLYLSLQIMELGIPMVLALNMMDEVRASGTYINVEELQKQLGVPVVPISAANGEGLDDLVAQALHTARERLVPAQIDFCEGPVHRAIHSVAYMVEDHARAAGVPMRFAGTKLIEGDEPMLKALALSKNERETIDHIVREMEAETGTDREAAMADMRYTFIEKAVKASVKKAGHSPAYERSVKIDNLLTSKYFGLPIFFGVMFLIFYLTFGPIGSFFSDILNQGIGALTTMTAGAMEALGVNSVLQSLVLDGIFAGVGSVLSFLPIIVTLFFFLSILEDSGYMARVAFVMDKLLRKIGLSGRSFVPMLIGFGCSVPAIMSARTLSSERDRKMTILLVPFMSCSAKVPIYAVFTAAFFPQNGAFVMISLYILGILMGILCGFIFRKTLFRGNSVPFVMELPNYRLPNAKSVLMLVWDKAKDFLVKAFTIIFAASIVIWVLQTFDFGLNVVSDSGSSMLSAIGRAISPVFAPLGFGDWRVVSALITGFSAKEAVVSTFAVLCGVSAEALPGVLPVLFSRLSAISFLVFTLLYTPCVAAVAAVKRELGGIKSAILVVCFQTGLAWVVSFAVYRAGLLLGL